MNMEAKRWPTEATDRIASMSEGVLVEDLRRAAYGEATLGAAFLTLDHWQAEQARAAADLLERETWALTTILAASGPIWQHLASPTLRFVLDRHDGPADYHLEVGLFGHLAALAGPSAGEQELVAATTPVWVRVYPHRERQLAGQTGPLACSYVPIPVAEAVAAIGFGTILAQIETATRTASEAVLARAHAQRAQEERLVAAERRLGWEADPQATPVERATAIRARLVLALLGHDGRGRSARGAALVGVAVVLLWLLIGAPHTMLALVVAVSGLLVWRQMGAS